MPDPWAEFRSPPAPPGPPQPPAPPGPPAGSDPWAEFRSPPAVPAQPAPAVPAQPAPVARPAAETRAEYAAQPWYAQAGQAADDIVRLLANGATFGYADKLAGAMGGGGTAAERVRTQEARDRAGLAGDVAEIGGSAALPVAAARSGMTLADLFGATAAKGIGGLAARTGLMGVEGAGYGALGAAGNDESISQGAATGAAFGAAGNVAAEGLTGAVSKVAGLFNKRPVIPTSDEVRTAAKAAYDAADNAGVIFTPDATDALMQRVTTDLAGMGYDPALQPGAAAVVRRAQDLVGQNVSLTGLDTLRKVASNGFIPGNASNNKAVNMLAGAIDDAVSNPTPGHVLTGNAQAGADALGEARGMWSRLAKENAITQGMDRAELRAASTGTGGNADNAIRQNMRRVLENPRGFTPDEQDALRLIVEGSGPQNALRRIGRFAPVGTVSAGSGIGLGALIGSYFGPGGAAVGAAAVPAVGQAAKWSADAMTRNNVDNLLDIIMAGGNKAATQVPPNLVQRAAEGNRDTLSRMFMSSQGNR